MLADDAGLINGRYAEKGMIKLSTYLILYRVGDIVDIKANAAQQKGMPHKYYHGCVSIRFLVLCLTDRPSLQLVI